MKSDCNFTFKHYREILELAKDEGYKFLKCEDLDKIKDFGNPAKELVKRKES